MTYNNFALRAEKYWKEFLVKYRLLDRDLQESKSQNYI
jgi:hypothetical protein